MNQSLLYFLRCGCIVLALLLGDGATRCITAADANGKTKAQRTDAFFADTNVPHFIIEVKGTNLNSIRRDPRKNVRATVRVGDQVFEDVALHLKGAAGSFRNFDDRPALTLNLDKFVEKQNFRGLDKFHLNNSVQDPTYLCEAVCGELFLAAGVPAARAAHARVTLNGRDLGFYGLKEGFNKQFLARFFKNNKGNLYDGGFIREITDDLERDSGEGDVANREDLKALAAAAKEEDDSDRLEEMRKVLDVDRFLSFMALEVMTWHWDGYCLKQNNYRVYHNLDDGKIVFMPHGMDQMFWDVNGALIPQFEGLVARALIHTPEGPGLYRARVAALLTNVFTAEKITNHIARMQARIQPALLALNKDAAQQQAGAARHLQNQILARIARLQRVVNEPLPEVLKPGVRRVARRGAPLAANGPAPDVLQFGADGYATLPDWREDSTQGGATLDIVKLEGGAETLHILAPRGRPSAASWRTRVNLPPGRYVLSARAKTTGVKLLMNDNDRKGVGAGIRISGTEDVRKNNLLGDTDWRNIEYEFTVAAGQEEVVLVAELRASSGEVWFERDSLKLRKK
jgi:spore coat protein H